MNPNQARLDCGSADAVGERAYSDQRRIAAEKFEYTFVQRGWMDPHRRTSTVPMADVEAARNTANAATNAGEPSVPPNASRIPRGPRSSAATRRGVKRSPTPRRGENR